MLSFGQQLESASIRLLAAVGRIAEIQRQSECELSREALAFNLERAAWSAIELAQAWVFELRLGLPRKETENFDLLQRHGWLELEQTRRLKQLSEFRSLSTREPERTDWLYLSSSLAEELGLFSEWAGLARSWEARAR